MEVLEFKIILKPGTSKNALAFIIAYHKAFKAHRFLFSTGIKVTRKGFDPARPGKALKTLLSTTETAYTSIITSGEPLTAKTLGARIKLIRDRISWEGSDLSIWNGAAIDRYTIPDGVTVTAITERLNQELLKHSPDFKKAINEVLTEGANGLFGFWQSVLDGKIKARHGKALRDSTRSAKRQTMLIVKEYDPAASFEKMDMGFYNGFTTWLSEQTLQEKGEDGKLKTVDRFDSNTIGKHVKDLKAILHLAYRNEILKNDRFKYWPVTREKNEVVTLSKDELLKYNGLALSGTKENVRDIFVMACFLGPRISDFVSFNDQSLSVSAGILWFQYVQEKTGARVKIPVHPIAQNILNKRGGKFPRMISEQNFRAELKEISKAAELNDRVIVKIRDGKPEYKKKWEAISPHSARRTFASSLFYGWFGRPMPASFCMRYTGHKTEKSFMVYIGATEKDLDAKALEYFDLTPEMKIA